MSDTEYDTSGNSNSSFHVGADILNLLFLYYIIILLYYFYIIIFTFLYFSMYSKC